MNNAWWRANSFRAKTQSKRFACLIDRHFYGEMREEKHYEKDAVEQTFYGVLYKHPLASQTSLLWCFIRQRLIYTINREEERVNYF
jgi:hypothetical protein